MKYLKKKLKKIEKQKSIKSLKREIQNRIDVKKGLSDYKGIFEQFEYVIKDSIIDYKENIDDCNTDIKNLKKRLKDLKKK